MSTRDPIALLVSFLVPYYERPGSDFVTVECAYHNDKDKIVGDDVSQCTGGIHKKTGAFKCFSCGDMAKANVIGFIAARMGLNEVIIKAQYDNITGAAKPGHVDPGVVEMCHQELLGHEELRARMYKQHGINHASIERWRLGYHPFDKRVIIPVLGPLGDYVQLRQYKYDSDGKNKVIGIKGGKATLWPLEALTQETIYITEGEFKAVLLHQYGFNAITGTAGAGTWNRESWSELFKNKHVIIIYDVDEAGRINADKLCMHLWSYAKSIKNVFLTDVLSIPKGDITNYFVDKQRSTENLHELVNKTPYYQPPLASASLLKLEKNVPIPVKLSQASNAVHNNKIISSTAVVSAKDTAPYIIPKKCTVVCPRNRPYCTACIAYTAEKPISFEIPNHSPILLELIGTASKAQDELLQAQSGIHPKCNVAAFNRDESYNVEELRLIPQIAIGHTSDEQVTRKAYYIGSGIAPNNTYDIEARVCPEPTDGHATMVIYDAKPIQNDLDNFKPTLDLKIFQPKEWSTTSIWDKLNDIYSDFEANVTNIYQRRDLHLFYDLIWHTVLNINFEGRDQKGWGDGLVIGDSGQGKSECSSRMSKHYKCGERVDTKRASVAGIVGGLQETAKRWFITWGTIPLNDRRLVILEEIKGMGAAELSKMTDMRSSGIAEITKIERARTRARTRLIWISNPRSDSKLGTYNYGVDAVKELIGGPEDIRRFDMVMAVATGEVPMSVINARKDSTIPHVYSSDLCEQLVAWSWSRQVEHIKLECIDEILAASTRMGKTYSSACPIVEEADQRMKLLRLSTALACRTFSTDETGENVIVRDCHVKVVEEYLNRIYSSKALGYKDFSTVQKGELTLTDPDLVKVRLKDLANAADTVKGFIECELIRLEDVINLAESTPESANEFIGFLIRKGCIRRSRRAGYRKTPAFIDLLKELDRENMPNETLHQQLDKEQF